jgi:hypothetical protein
MNLDDLSDIFHALRFPGQEERTHPERELVLAARSGIAKAVIDDEFLADCISWELRFIENGRLRQGLMPFFTVPGMGIRFAFGYWPPGGTPGPHEHTAWTITAVCRNKLDVLTYERDQSYRRRELVPKNRFQASAGEVGFIYEPCIHEPRNTSNDWSLSLHVISPRDGERLGDFEESLPALSSISKLPAVQYEHPYTNVIGARQRRRCVHQLTRVLASIDVARTPDLLAKCSRLGSSATRRLIDQAAQRPLLETGGESRWLLARTHEGLTLTYRCRGDMVALDVETSNGPLEELVINDVAREAIAFVTRESVFDVRSLPGNLTEEERTAIAEALEETGLFTRVLP